jgi:hypothetical protein
MQVFLAHMNKVSSRLFQVANFFDMWSDVGSYNVGAAGGKTRRCSARKVRESKS